MSGKCGHCGSPIPEGAEYCPSCGEKVPEAAPQTLEELAAWYAERGLPPEEVTRFFIGKDVSEPRAFGIYRDGDSFVVYKNKSNGSRAVRYHGPDEAYAVREFYARLTQEILDQKAAGAARRERDVLAEERERRVTRIRRILWIAVCAVILAYVVATYDEPRSGYYMYADDLWYLYGGAWYLYDEGWEPADAPYELRENYRDYYGDSTYYDEFGAEDFRGSGYWRGSSSSSSSSYSSSSYSDYDWDDDYDSWDSSYTDWDSDW